MGGFDWLVKKCIIIECVAGPEAVATIGGFVTGGAWRALGGVFLHFAAKGGATDRGFWNESFLSAAIRQVHRRIDEGLR